MTLRNSSTEPGQPWESRSGVASGSGDRMWRKWMSDPSIIVRLLPQPLSSASAVRQS